MSSNTRNCIPMQNKHDRVVLLVDMDCFYCQVEEKLDPTLAGQPLAVVQYNAWRGGGIIAVNYAARASGVTRHMRGDEAKEQCPDIQLIKVPNVRGKADLSKYRDAGKEVANVLQRYTPLLERASVDEAYLDISQAVNERLEQMCAGTFVLTPCELNNTYAVGYNNIGEYISEILPTAAQMASDDGNNVDDIAFLRKSDVRLLIGSSIATDIRTAVKLATGYECSAGIAHNKILAKLACGLNKPNKQTILPLSRIATFFETLPVGKIKGLGAKFGVEVCEKLGIRFLGQLAQFTEVELQRKFDEKNGAWLYNIAHGIDLEAVTPRFYSKSIGCCKKFPGSNNITGLKTLSHWLNELANEIEERLEKDTIENNRRAKQMVVTYIQEIDGEQISSSRSTPLLSYESEKIAKSSLEIIKINTKQFLRAGSSSVLHNPIKLLGISVGKFETISNGAQTTLQQMFANHAVSNNSGETTKDNGQKNKNGNIVESKQNKGNQSALHKYLTSFEKQKNVNLSEIPLNAGDDVVVVGYDEAKKQLEIKNSDPKETSNPINATNIVVDKEFLLKVSNLDNNDESSTLSDNKTMNTQMVKLFASSKNSFFLNALKKRNSEMAEKMLESTNVEVVACIENAANVNNQNNAETTTLQFEKDETLAQNRNFKCELTTNALKCDGIKRKYAELTDSLTGPSSSNTTTTTSQTVTTSVFDETQYAEFAVPELSTADMYTECSICRARILNTANAIQMHQDQHLAQQLSKQQRLEYQQQFKAKIQNCKQNKRPTKANNSNNNSNSKNNKKTTNNNITDITKFMKQSVQDTLNNDSQTDAANVECKMCPTCSTPIPIDQFDEHLDFHVAKSLQRELNRLEVRTITLTKPTDSTRSQHKKSHNKSLNCSTSKATVIARKPITHFFTQTNS